jgi:hypothetical protein
LGRRQSHRHALRKTPTGYLVTLTDNGTPYQAAAQVYDGETLLGEGTLDIHAPVAVLASGANHRCKSG